MSDKEGRLAIQSFGVVYFPCCSLSLVVALGGVLRSALFRFYNLKSRVVVCIGLQPLGPLTH